MSKSHRKFGSENGLGCDVDTALSVSFPANDRLGDRTKLQICLALQILCILFIHVHSVR
jgi:hypothetical protein